MYKVYFKQAIAMLKQNKFMSIITIVGTALAITMIMVIITAESVKNISVAPEVNRSRTLYLKFFSKTKKDVNNPRNWQSTLPYDLYRDYLSDFKTPEYTTAIVDKSRDEGLLQVKKHNSDEEVTGVVRMVDDAYWKVMSFAFVKGQPFSKEDFSSGIKNVVLSDRFAQEIFGNEDPLGNEVEIDLNRYKVVGVVKNVSQIFDYSYGDAYVPYTATNAYDSRRQYHVLFLMNDINDQPALEAEFRAAERKFNAADPEWNLILEGPFNHRGNRLKMYSKHVVDLKKTDLQMLLVFSVLLLIPAVNLSSFSMSRIRRRTEEIGVRKAFGAKKQVILIQVLYENFITSLIGGFIGLIFSFIIVVWLKEWLLGISASSGVPISALVSIPTFVSVFVVCVLLNLLSAGIPAYRASRMNIVNSLNRNDL